MTRPSFRHRAVPRLLVCAIAGLAVGLAVGIPGDWEVGLGAGWTVCAGGASLWIWLAVRGMDGEATREHAAAEDSGRAGADLIWTISVLASLVGVAILLIAGAQRGGSSEGAAYLHAGLGVLMVVSSWFLIHLLFMLRYAREYWSEGAERAIDFPGDEAPDYHDFAYLAFCLGMTYQVSDTDLRSRRVRRTVMQHTLLSYLLGAVVVACTVNLVVSIAGGSGG